MEKEKNAICQKVKNFLLMVYNKFAAFINNHISIDSKKKKIYLGVFIVSAIVAVLLIVSLIIHLVPSPKTDFSDYHSSTQINLNEISDEPIEPVVDFEKLKNENWDVCGWIQIPNTNIDYPILQSDDKTDDSFYLNHGFDKKELFDGSIFISKENDNDFNDRNTVIYGHNLKNKQMFTQLHNYKKSNFFNENQYVYIHKPRHIYVYRVFAAVVFDDRDILNSYDFKSEDASQQFFEDLNSFSKLKSGQFQDDFKLAGDNQIITLSTCTGKKNERFIVVAAKVGDQKTNK